MADSKSDIPDRYEKAVSIAAELTAAPGRTSRVITASLVAELVEQFDLPVLAEDFAAIATSLSELVASQEVFAALDGVAPAPGFNPRWL